MAKQLSLALRRRGGKRARAGRKPVGDRAGTPHRPRESFSSAKPVLVTKRVVPGAWGLRRKDAYLKVRDAIEQTNRLGFVKVVHWSVLGNHLHLIVEAGCSRDLRRGMQGFFIRLARALNRLIRRVGAVFADRFHSRVLKTPREVRNAIQYVLLNARRHGIGRALKLWLDPCSSGAVFDGWTKRPIVRGGSCIPAAEPRTWLLRVGWRRHGRIDPVYVPG